MKIILRELKTYKVYANCDCGGNMNQMDYIRTNVDTTIKHECDRCGKIEEYGKVYPHVIYKEI